MSKFNLVFFDRNSSQQKPGAKHPGEAVQVIADATVVALRARFGDNLGGVTVSLETGFPDRGVFLRNAKSGIGSLIVSIGMYNSSLVEPHTLDFIAGKPSGSSDNHGQNWKPHAVAWAYRNIPKPLNADLVEEFCKHSDAKIRPAIAASSDVDVGVMYYQPDPASVGEGSVALIRLDIRAEGFTDTFTGGKRIAHMLAERLTTTCFSLAQRGASVR